MSSYTKLHPQYYNNLSDSSDSELDKAELKRLKAFLKQRPSMDTKKQAAELPKRHASTKPKRSKSKAAVHENENKSMIMPEKKKVERKPKRRSPDHEFCLELDRSGLYNSAVSKHLYEDHVIKTKVNSLHNSIVNQEKALKNMQKKIAKEKNELSEIQDHINFQKKKDQFREETTALVSSLLSAWPHEAEKSRRKSAVVSKKPTRRAEYQENTGYESRPRSAKKEKKSMRNKENEYEQSYERGYKSVLNERQSVRGVIDGTYDQSYLKDTSKLLSGEKSSIPDKRYKTPRVSDGRGAGHSVRFGDKSDIMTREDLELTKEQNRYHQEAVKVKSAKKNLTKKYEKELEELKAEIDALHGENVMLKSKITSKKDLEKIEDIYETRIKELEEAVIRKDRDIAERDGYYKGQIEDITIKTQELKGEVEKMGNYREQIEDYKEQLQIKEKELQMIKKFYMDKLHAKMAGQMSKKYDWSKTYRAIMEEVKNLKGEVDLLAFENAKSSSSNHTSSFISKGEDSEAASRR